MAKFDNDNLTINKEFRIGRGYNMNNNDYNFSYKEEESFGYEEEMDETDTLEIDDSNTYYDELEELHYQQQFSEVETETYMVR